MSLTACSLDGRGMERLPIAFCVGGENLPPVRIFGAAVVAFVEVAVAHEVDVMLLKHWLYKDTYLWHVLFTDREEVQRS